MAPSKIMFACSDFQQVVVFNKSDLKQLFFVAAVSAIAHTQDFGSRTNTSLTKIILSQVYTLQGTNISHLGKRKIIDSKVPWEKDRYVSSLEGIFNFQKNVCYNFPPWSNRKPQLLPWNCLHPRAAKGRDHASRNAVESEFALDVLQIPTPPGTL